MINQIPSSITSNQPYLGTFTSATPSTLDTWEETKYIVYKQTDPSGLQSPYLDVNAA